MIFKARVQLGGVIRGAKSGHKEIHLGTCAGCDPARLLERVSRHDLTPEIHYGTVGSSNTLIKDGMVREGLRKDLDIICVEMEAAGLIDEFLNLIIRGICDYADSHKSKY
jgi:nucleoside phosphorylase